MAVQRPLLRGTSGLSRSAELLSVASQGGCRTCWEAGRRATLAKLVLVKLILGEFCYPVAVFNVDFKYELGRKLLLRDKSCKVKVSCN